MSASWEQGDHRFKKKKKNSFPEIGKRFFKRKMTSQSSGNEFSKEK